jgi:hypothetical protein
LNVASPIPPNIKMVGYPWRDFMKIVRWKDMDVDTKFFVVRLALGLLLINQIILVILILLN